MRRQLRTLIAPTFVIGLGGIVVLLVVWGVALRMSSVADNKKTVRVLHQFIAFKRVLDELENADRPPSPSLAELFSNSSEVGLPDLRTGVDPWGSPFYYEVRIHIRGSTSTSYDVILRSLGPNQQDDGGLRDDLERTYFVIANNEADPH